MLSNKGMHLNNFDLHVELSGEGAPLLWAHALMSSIAHEDALHGLWCMPPRDVQLVRYDARGHGRSPPSDAASDYTWPALGRDLLAVADALDARRFIAGGMSMGCAAALHAALAAPQRIEALLLVLPPAIWEGRVEQAHHYRRAVRLGQMAGGRMLGKLMSRDAGRVLPAWLAQAAPDKVALAADGMRQVANGALSAMFDGAAQSDLPEPVEFEALAAIPALIVGWAGDAAHPLASAERLHALLPKSELLVVDDYEGWLAVPDRLRSFAGGQGTGQTS